jgi:hypothetical protein
MDEGNCLYFGPWNAHAQELLGRYLPASHLLAAAGGAEQPREVKKKAAVKKEEKKDKVCGWAGGDAGARCLRMGSIIGHSCALVLTLCAPLLCRLLTLARPRLFTAPASP